MKQLRELIECEIRERGPIPFSRYMELCLYAPGGYYSGARQQFGRAGDFYTSSDVHALFGRLLSRQFDQMWRTLGSPERLDVVELGPGRGLFAQDVLDWTAKKFGEFHRALHYTLVEASSGLRDRLQERFENQNVSLLTSLAETRAPFANAIVFTNELFDALPVEIVSDRGQVYVTMDNGRFVETFQPSSSAVNDYLDRYSIHPRAGERVEVCLAAEPLVRQVSAAVQRGFCLFVDYGYTREEQLQGRHLDTLMTYREHSAGTDPYAAPGEQDITAHVNFTALSAMARACGFDAFPLVTQSQFLIGIGEDTQFADAFTDCKLPQEQAKVALQLKHLATPAGMGEVFHVLVLSRGVEKEKAAQLDGLKFAREIPLR